jgi:hypothetical protein
MLRTHAPGHSARLSSPPATVEPFAAPGELRFYEVGSEAGGLGSVWIQREFMTAAAILIMAAKL